MNWTKASAIAEIVSSIAILLTLVYLGIQTRQLTRQTAQNTAAAISNSRQQSLDTEAALLLKMMDYAEDQTRPGQSAADVRVDLANGVFLRIRKIQWLQYKDGLLDQATWNSYMKILLLQLSRDDDARMRSYWESTSQTGIFTPGFVSEVNRALAEFKSPNKAD